jgi:streptomycin 3"-adenylyltransferase
MYPATAQTQLDELVSALQPQLADNLVGVYLHGSLAMGCFNPQSSDIDLLVAIQHSLDPQAKRRVAELLLDQSNAPHPLEISFLTQANLRPWRHPTPFDFHYSETWRQRYEQELANGDRWRWSEEPSTDSDLAAHIMITNHRGICLYGAPIPQAFPSVPEKDYVDSIVGDFRWAVEGERLVANPVYFVLNACRVYAYLLERRIYSKEEGAVWALEQPGILSEQWPPIVSQALTVYRRAGRAPKQIGLR